MKLRSAIRTVGPYAGLLGVLLLLILFFSVMTENFFQQSTVVMIANRIPEFTFVAVGMTLVLIVAGIDLSVGSVLALGSAVLAVAMVQWQWPLWAAAMMALTIGAVCGLLNGAISIGFGIPSFIVTLGMLEIARGGTKVVTDSKMIFIGSDVEGIAEPMAGLLISPAFIMALAAVGLGQFLLTQTVFGRYCVAIGTNREAVRMSGIRTAPYAIGVFVISGMMAAMAGISQASRLSTADPNGAIGIELAAIAACVIGGTSLMGGRGSVVATFVGVLIIATLESGLAQMGVPDAHKQIVTGIVIITAVLLDALRHRF